MNTSSGQLIDESCVDQISWDSIPAPPHAQVQGAHLFVNVRYGGRFVNSSADSFLATAEIDAVTIVENAVKSGIATGNESICISFFIDEGKLRGRALRVSVMKSDFQSFVTNTACLLDKGAIVTSEVHEVESLLNR